MTISLIGFKASGKTSVGETLAEKIGWDFIDTDRCIEAYYFNLTGVKLDCREIFKRVGEFAFRDMEKSAILQFEPSSAAVIATGGGSVCDPDVVQHLRTYGELYYLNAPCETCIERIRSEFLPAFISCTNSEQQLRDLYHQRKKIYWEIADHQIEVQDRSIAVLAEEIWNLILSASLS